MAKPPIVLVHGAWVTADSWAPFKATLEAAGHQVTVPTWPGLEGRTVAQLNEAQPEGFARLTIGRIVDHYVRVIAAMSEPPVLVGHSFGGLTVQLLLDRGFGTGGVAINPAPIGGIVPGKTALSAIYPALLRWNGWNKPYAHTPRSFEQQYANTAPAGMLSRFFQENVIPAPGRIFFQAASWIGTGVDPKRRTQPLLITGSSHDRLISPYMSEAACEIQRRSAAPTDYIFFNGLSHLLIAEPGYERVSAEVVEWIGRQNV